MNEIKKRILKKELQYDNTTILTYQIEYPEMISSMYRLGRRVFNQDNREKAFKLQKYAETQLFEDAKKTYQYNKENGYPIMVFEVLSKYEVTCNRDRIVSLYQDEYQFTGGAHGNTVRSSQNWNLQTTKQIPLANLYPDNPYYVIDILKQINAQIAKQIEQEGSSIYFDNYCQLVLETFCLESYYMKPEHLVVFFQQYDIAPYSTGIPTFTLLWGLKDR